MEDLITDELRAELGDNISILPAKRVRGKVPSNNATPSSKPLSANAQKKLAKIQKKKADNALRAERLQSIRSRSLSQTDIRLMQSSGRMGQRDSRRQVAKRDLYLERSGLKRLGSDRHIAADDEDVTYVDDDDDCMRDDCEPLLPTCTRTTTSTTSTTTITDREEVPHTYTLDCIEETPSAAVISSSFISPSIPTSISVVHVSQRPKRRRRVLLDLTQSQSDPVPVLVSSAPIPEPVLEPETSVISKVNISDKAAALPDPTNAVSTNTNAPAIPNPNRFVVVERPESIESERRHLPVYMEEQKIMEAITDHDIVLICGATGSGKTTQIPQFLYEAGYGSLPGRTGTIGITQPRRVAAVAMADRVRHEMGNHGDRVAYHIRYDGHQVTDQTAMKFMTDGILLREIQSDFLLTSYSVIIIDEAHERSLNTDVLIGLLSRIVPLRRRTRPDSPLKLIIMSATLRVRDFADNAALFADCPPPIVEIAGRQHPVTIHFSKKTSMDYITATIDKITQIHRQLPPGGILAFVPGKHDINVIIKQLQQRLHSNQQFTKDDTDLERDRFWNGGHDQIDADDDLVDDRRADDDDDYDAGEKEESVSDLEWDGEQAPAVSNRPCVIVPLHALLSPSDQARVFAPLPTPEHRLIVVATNVAETSLTLPDIKYVVDSGREKRRVYDATTGLSSLTVSFISRPSADQRAGRAGRTGPGHVYRLYSNAVYDNELDEAGAVEIEQCPIDATVLALKAMSIDDIGKFPFPTAPSSTALQSALTLLTRLGALNSKPPHSITSVGRIMASLPLTPRYGRMMAISAQDGCQLYIIAIVSVMSIEEIFVADKSDQDDRISYRQIRQKWSDPNSDVLGALAIVLAHGFAPDPASFCRENYLRPRAMFEISRLRRQLHEQLGLGPAPALGPPNPDQRVLLCQMIGAGLCDQIARRHPSVPGAFECMNVPDPVYIHPDSDLARCDPAPDLVAYRDLVHCTTGQIRIRGLTRLHARHIYRLCPQLCQVGPRPRPGRPAQYNRDQDRIDAWYTCTYGPGRWPLPDVLQPANSFKYERIWFVRLLLQGEVIPSWAQIGPWLSYRPSTITEIQAQTRPVMEFVNQFTSELTSIAALRQRWSQNPSFLKSQTRELIQRSCRDRLDHIWPQLIQ